ncbi:P-loop NTPase [Actinophytocola sp.]|uniref:Mrp/NBP35 family ATP-binding protein n=1 Tax=Actinophytocola sp. TaxID=1872138 RepID=UPI0025BF87BC|nr:P-loop NTPase [Actinophytocola sp.]
MATVHDPEIHQPLTELGMVAGVHAHRAGTVTVDLTLTTDGCPLRARIEDDVTAAVRAVAGVRDVRVRFGLMSQSQRQDLARRLRSSRAHGFGILDPDVRVYAVASGKGGVGKSTVTANLAVTLAMAGQRVGVLDADVWGHSIPQLFGVRRAPVALGGMMPPVDAHGVRLMSTGFFVDDDQPVVWRGPMLHNALEQFLGDVHWGELDVLLVDLPPGTGDVTISLLELLPAARLLVVTTPQPAASAVAARAGRMAADSGLPVAGVIENMTGGGRMPLFGSGGGRRLASALGAPLLGGVPLDVAIREYGDLGVPVAAREPESASAQVFRRLAAALPRGGRRLAGVALPLSVI